MFLEFNTRCSITFSMNLFCSINLESLVQPSVPRDHWSYLFNEESP